MGGRFLGSKRFFLKKEAKTFIHEPWTMTHPFRRVATQHIRKLKWPSLQGVTNRPPIQQILRRIDALAIPLRQAGQVASRRTRGRVR